MSPANLKKDGAVSVPGFLFSSLSCGIKENRRNDLALIFAENPAVAAALFTANELKAAPVLIGMENIKKGKCRAILANSGHANAMTGTKGMKAALSTVKALARELDIEQSFVIPSSTGLIGGNFPAEKIVRALPRLVSSLRPDGAEKVADAIMTTDRFAKISLEKIKAGGRTGTICAIGKGAGMIAPDMATMLCFVLTDIKISKAFAGQTLRKAVRDSFNRIIVDGDMSTNDSVFLLSSGAAGNATVSPQSADGRRFQKAVARACSDIARMIVRDGEGATKTARIEVEGARSGTDANKAARAVGGSVLVKCALFGEDPNFGRIAAAVGSSGIKFNPAGMDIFIGGLKVVSGGKESANAGEKAAKIMKRSELTIRVRLSEGKAKAFVLASDLSPDYVKLNSEYRS